MRGVHLLIIAGIVCLGLLSLIINKQIGLLRYVEVTRDLQFARLEKLIFELDKKNTDLETAIRDKDTRLAEALEEERTARKITEAQAKISNLSSQVKIAELSKNLEASKLPSTSEIVAIWSSRIVLVSCDFGRYTSSGSGVLARVPQEGGTYAPRVITSKHVITDNFSRGAISCTSKFTNGTSVISKTLNKEVEISKAGYDFGYLGSSSWPSSLDGITSNQMNICKSANVKTGDSVLILGYPGIGSDKDITATEGIVSGREGDYFVTSAKVERGNSGGAAILIKENCYLGIPTFVESGSLESIARIFDASLLGI